MGTSARIRATAGAERGPALHPGGLSEARDPDADVSTPGSPVCVHCFRWAWGFCGATCDDHQESHCVSLKQGFPGPFLSHCLLPGCFLFKEPHLGSHGLYSILQAQRDHLTWLHAPGAALLAPRVTATEERWTSTRPNGNLCLGAGLEKCKPGDKVSSPQVSPSHNAGVLSC